MRQAYRILFFSLLLIVATTLCANDTSFTAANLTVTWSQTDRAFTIRGTLADGTTRDLVVCSKPRAIYKNNEGIESGDLTSDAYQQVSYETHPLEDLFGSGTEHIFTFSNPAGDGDDVVMQQSFFAYDEQDGILYPVSEQFNFVAGVKGTVQEPCIFHIGMPETTGLTDIAISGSPHLSLEGFYTLNGMRVGSLQTSLPSGIYIAKYQDGSFRKVYIK